MSGAKTHNPVLWLVVALPATAVIASFATLFISLRGGDVPLPERYHWEGTEYDADQARLEQARQTGLSALLWYVPAAQQCVVHLTGAAPDSLRLELTDGSKPSNDRHLQLRRQGTDYAASCVALPTAHWWVEIADSAGHWTLRTRLRGNLLAPLLVSSVLSDGSS